MIHSTESFIYYKIIYNNMNEQFVRTIRKTGTSLGVNIPIEIIKLLELKEGDLIKVVIEKIQRSEKHD